MIDPFLLFAGATTAVALVARAASRAPSLRQLRAARLRATLSSEAREGQWVKISGRVELTQALLAPLTGRSCAWYEARATVQEEFGARAEEQGRADVLLRDDQGPVLVRADSACRFVIASVRFTASASDDQPRVRAFFHKRGRDPLGLERITCEERALVEGSTAQVVGFARWLPDAEGAGASYREAGRRLELVGSRSHPLYVFAGPRGDVQSRP